MDAGRKLDALVAEKVMGQSYKPRHFRDSVHGPDEWVDTTPKFSTDIAAAWEVLEHLGHLFVSIEKATDGMDVWWEAQIGNESAKGKTVPLAICRAALAAVVLPATA